MDARMFVGIAGAAVIVLAAVGLAVDLDRGGLRAHDVVAVTHDTSLSLVLTVTEGTTGPAGQCLITQCTPTTSTITLQVDDLPDHSALGLRYVLDVGPDEGLGPMRQQGGWSYDHAFPRDITGEPLTLRATDGTWSRELYVGTATDATDVPLRIQWIGGAATLQTEQIGAVEVSALIAAHVDDAAPDGWAFQAVIDGQPIGVLDGGLLDVRIERLDIGAADRFELKLVRAGAVATDPFAPTPGIVVFTATL